MKTIMFLLPVKGGSGGAHSVMQEADAMCALGFPVAIACNDANIAYLKDNYSDMPFIGSKIFGYNDVNSLRELIKLIDPFICVATTNQSVHALSSAIKGGLSVRSAYYIQDYEPLFYRPGSDEWLTAYSSYGLIPGMLHFAKTRWIQETIAENHGINVAKVLASVDHSLYKPDFGMIPGIGSTREFCSIAAMVRPATPRRAPLRTVRILNSLCERYGENFRIRVFGCRIEELRSYQLDLNPNIEVLGVLKRAEVASLFRDTDLFLDLSDFQAFGRTSIEAMACGVISIVPSHGGVHEYAVDGVNSFIVDTRLDSAILRAVESFMIMPIADKIGMRLKAISKSFEYTLELAALSEISVLYSSE